MPTINVQGVGDLNVPDIFKTWDRATQDEFVKYAVANKPAIIDKPVLPSPESVPETGITNTPALPSTESIPEVDVAPPPAPSPPKSKFSALQEAQIKSLVGRGIPRDKAEAFVQKDNSFYQSEKQIVDFQALPEYNKLVERWNKLPQDEKDGFLSNSPWVAGVASFVDHVLPIPVLWALGAFVPDFQAKLDHAMRENKGASNKSAVVGTVLGLIGGVAIARNAVKAGFDIIVKGPRAAARHSTRLIEKKIGRLKQQIANIPSRAIPILDDTKRIAHNTKSIREMTEFLKRTREIYRAPGKRGGMQAARDFANRHLRGLDADNPLKLVLNNAGKKDDFFRNWLVGDVEPSKWPKSIFGDYIGEPISQAQRALVARGIPSALEAVVGATSQFATEMGYAYKSAKRQGFSDDEARKAAFKYAYARSPEDFAAAAIQAFGGDWGAVVSAALKTWIGVSDTDTEGEVILSPSQTPLVKGPTDTVTGLLSGKYSPQSKNKGGLLSDKISKVYKEGYKSPGQAYAIAKSYQKRGLLSK